jgi:hypothetical protein
LYRALEPSHFRPVQFLRSFQQCISAVAAYSWAVGSASSH